MSAANNPNRLPTEGDIIEWVTDKHVLKQGYVHWTSTKLRSLVSSIPDNLIWTVPITKIKLLNGEPYSPPTT